MPRPVPLPHLQTFARLRGATAADLADLAALEAGLADTGEPLDWGRQLANPATRVTLAVECDALVGASITSHRPHAAIASLDWLDVERSARRRGIGSLLLKTAISEARAGGAALLRAAIGGQHALASLYGAGGLVDTQNPECFEMSLWQSDGLLPLQPFEPRYFPATGSADPAACALIMAMASLDGRLMMTPRVESVIRAEATGTGLPHLHALALSAAHRGFNVTLCGGERPELTAADVLGAGSIDWRGSVPMPEELAGLISRRHVPVAALNVPRLHQSRRPHWAMVCGFDGFLFRLFDAELAAERRDALTIEEMRRGLADPGAACLLVHRGIETSHA